MDINSWLVISGRWEHLWLWRRNRRVAVDQLREHTTHCFDTQWQWRHIKQNHVLNVTSNHTTLHSGTQSNRFVRVNWVIRLLASQSLNRLLHSRNTRWTTVQDNLVDVVDWQTSILQSLTNRLFRTLYQVSRQLVELGTRQSRLQVQWTSFGCRNKWQIDLCFSCWWQRLLCRLCSILQTLQGQLVSLQINPIFSLEVIGQPVNNLLVKVVTTKVCVTICWQNFENTITQLKDRNVKRSTTQVINKDLFVVFQLVQTVCQSSSRWLVDDTLNFQAGDLTSILSCLTLRIIKVSRHRDNSLINRLTKVIFSVLLGVLQDNGWNFLWRVVLAINRYLVTSFTHVWLDWQNRVRVCNSLPLSSITDLRLTVLKWNSWWRRATTVWVSDNLWLATFQNGNSWVCCSQINSNDLWHNVFTSYWSIFIFNSKWIVV